MAAILYLNTGRVILLEKRCLIIIIVDIFKSCCESYVIELQSRSRALLHLAWLWDAMLKHTRIRFELLTDNDIVLFIKCGICDGLSNVQTNTCRLITSIRVRTTCRNYHCTLCDYYDVNNLDRWCVNHCQPMPTFNPRRTAHRLHCKFWCERDRFRFVFFHWLYSRD